MVIDKKTYQKILKSPDLLNYPDSLELEKITQQYPFFQSAIILYVKLLKDNHILHNSMLYKAAAYTTDRSVLFRYLENIVNFSEKPEEDNEEENKLFEDIEKENTENAKFEETAQKLTSNHPKTEQKRPEKMSYSEWMRYISQVGKPKTVKQDPIFDLIDKFLKDKPKIVAKRDKITPAPENIIKSVEEKQMLMTETLANLYVKQKKYGKAIQAFKILSLKYPKKSSYFANRINELKNQIK